MMCLTSLFHHRGVGDILKGAKITSRNSILTDSCRGETRNWSENRIGTDDKKHCLVDGCVSFHGFNLLEFIF